MSLTAEPRKFLSKTVYSSKCSVSIKFVAAHFVFHCSQRFSNNFPMRMLVGLQVAIVFIGWFSLWHFNDPRSPRDLNRSSFSWLFSWAHLAAAHSRIAQSQALFSFLATYFRGTFWQLLAFVELRGAFSVARWFRLNRLTAARLRWAARCSFLCSLVLFGNSWKLLVCVELRGAHSSARWFCSAIVESCSLAVCCEVLSSFLASGRQSHVTLQSSAPRYTLPGSPSEFCGRQSHIKARLHMRFLMRFRIQNAPYPTLHERLFREA